VFEPGEVCDTDGQIELCVNTKDENSVLSHKVYKEEHGKCACCKNPSSKINPKDCNQLDPTTADGSKICKNIQADSNEVVLYGSCTDENDLRTTAIPCKCGNNDIKAGDVCYNSKNYPKCVGGGKVSQEACACCMNQLEDNPTCTIDSVVSKKCVFDRGLNDCMFEMGSL
jgi:hypothetical protein